MTFQDIKEKTFGKAGIYHNLGIVAREQRKWPQAEEYYQKALEICIEFNYSQASASTYHELGTVAQEQRLWDIARENLLKALEIFFEFGDQHKSEIALRGLSRLWQATTDRRVLDEVTRILSIDQEEAKKLLEREG